SRRRRQWNDHCASLRLLCPGRKAVGYALHPENRTLQPVQLSFLGLIQSRKSLPVSFRNTSSRFAGRLR
ncbi:MAG: hypothetical protein WC091_16685, partial [Sulfuricellaceae bacterium]